MVSFTIISENIQKYNFCLSFYYHLMNQFPTFPNFHVRIYPLINNDEKLPKHTFQKPFEVNISGVFHDYA